MSPALFAILCVSKAKKGLLFANNPIMQSVVFYKQKMRGKCAYIVIGTEIRCNSVYLSSTTLLPIKLE